MRPTSCRQVVLATLCLLSLVLVLASGCGGEAGIDGAPVETLIARQAEDLRAELIGIRRDLHQHPEIAGEEVRTSGIVAATLEAAGLEVRTGLGGHGVVGILHGKEDGPVVAYRADMDALSQDIEEEVPYRSATPGMGHACGHDVHTTVGLGIARVLASLGDKLPGTVVFVFQPAEETVEGARAMLAVGALADPAPEAIFALHVAPVEAGQLVTNPGVGLPGIEQFAISLSGPGDLEETASGLAEAIRALGTVHYPEDAAGWNSQFGAIFENDSHLSSFLLSLAWVDGSAAGEEAVVAGFFKAAGPAEYAEGKARLAGLLAGLEDKGISSRLESEKVLADMICDERLATWAIEPIEAVLGQDAVLTAHHSLPFFGEDFAYFLQRTPGAMFYLGASNTQEGIIALPHSPAFSVDEDAILHGVKGMSALLARYLLDPPESG
jgi:metal-dependent amidase/aminoacylase/carboxypeptidase family protein